MALKTGGKIPGITRTGGEFPSNKRVAMGGPAMKALATPSKIRTPRNLSKLNIALK